MVGIGLILIAVLMVAGCEQPQPITSVNVHDNAGDVTVVATGGGNSPASTAPCGATSGPQKGNGLAAPTPDCSDNTAPPTVVPGPTP